MRFAFSLGILLAMTPTYGFAETIRVPRVHGQLVDHCLAINGDTDCRRPMMTATTVCTEYGFRRAVGYGLRSTRTAVIQLRLTISDQETVIASEWRPVALAVPFASIECSK